jgi:hypothetical protein
LNPGGYVRWGRGGPLHGSKNDFILPPFLVISPMVQVFTRRINGGKAEKAAGARVAVAIWIPGGGLPSKPFYSKTISTSSFLMITLMVSVFTQMIGGEADLASVSTRTGRILSQSQFNSSLLPKSPFNSRLKKGNSNAMLTEIFLA